MGLDFKEAFSSFLHQYFHANATFWNSVKICGNFKVAVDDYQEDYLFSEVITKSDCCCSNGLDKINTPIRGSGQAPIIIKEEPNEANRPSVLSGEVVTTSCTNLSSITNTSTTNTVISNNASLSTTSSSNGNNTNTIQTVADKTNNCGTTSSQSSHIETVLSPDTNYAVPPTRPSRWYISNCQPQTSDIDGRTILPSMPLLVTSTPAAPSSPNKITDMLQITSCEGEEEAAALQTFSSAQDPIPTEESVTLQGATSFATETQVAGQPPSLLSSYMKTPVGSVGQFVDQSIAKVEPISSMKHLVGHVDTTTVESVVSGVKLVHQIVPKRESTSACEDQGSEIHLSYSHKDNSKNKNPNADLFCSAPGSFQPPFSNPQTTVKPHLSPKSKSSISTPTFNSNLTRQLILRRTASPSMKVFRKTLNKALRLSYQKASNFNIKGLSTDMKSPNIKFSNPYFKPSESVTTETSLTAERNHDITNRTHILTLPKKDDFVYCPTNQGISDLSQVLSAQKSIKSTLPLSSPAHKLNQTMMKVPNRSSLKSTLYQSKYKVGNSLSQISSPLPTVSHEKINDFISQQAPATFKTIESIDLTIDNDNFPRRRRSNAIYRSQFLCTTCGKYFTRKSSLNEHKKDVHEKTNDKFICCICSKRFTRPQHLRDHMNIHYMCKPHKCTSCGHKFFNKISLLRHKRKCYSDQSISAAEQTVTAI
ncbi:A-agglutinin anchorage subunit isoform X1 [Octopus vulgaris]|uniref:A-agglutinin anchorage subunit isoform X1 n=1 Tax=Octopus vulgaris TaxID=6645 RepID=A0AA36EZD2_OCTVU|nr:A-agglutinin anchorage subunit isoform X1 [Octopus vulgaris]